ncbi:hypothetical protein BJ993_000733 [Nocardioides aromaticivorans]|uniref:DUF222 domain-containing protein n=1 Tax=Nocardioides aromaticivorans TaxID=200618 RepID=A0A7Y9ZFM6_9ACTN|nr:hypothetical protein [Nocardioides aromaticivorans]NYI43653.1 hypothetical protein [Nocardioides aromaticivorans]
MAELAYLDAAALLAAEESGVRQRRQADVEAMDRLLAWCDHHSEDPQSQPGAVPGIGGDRLVTIGGEGTPPVAELCFEEFAIAAHAGVIATANRAADLLDLRHRLPNVYDAVRALRLELWVARKVASMSRRLDRDRVTVVDIAVAAAADESPSRVLALAEAKVIEADVEAHRRRIADDEARKGVWLRRKRPGERAGGIAAEADVQSLGMRLSTAGAEELAEFIDHLAGTIADQHVPTHPDDVKTMDQFRAEAAELLADPAAALALLTGPPDQPDEPDQPAPESLAAKRHRRPATINVFLSQDVLSGNADGVARVDGIGPLLLDQLAALLHRRDIAVLPVVDLTIGRAVSGYEHPTSMKRRTLLRTRRDVFPHSPRRGTSLLDHDHPSPYDPTGPPGQTSDHNDAPLARRDHRAKTHLGFRVVQLGLGAYRWETPHGLARVVTGNGTTSVELIRDRKGKAIGEIYPAHRRVACALSTM